MQDNRRHIKGVPGGEDDNMSKECQWEDTHPLLIDAGEEPDGVPFLPCVCDMECIHGRQLEPADLAGVV